jgi:hypothetical protein
MIDELKEIEDGSLITFDNEEISALTSDPIAVSSVKICNSEDNEIVIVGMEMDEYCLVAHNFDTDPRYFFYQTFDAGSAEELENDGYYFLTEEQDFRNKIVCRDDTRGHVYKHSEIGAVYEMVVATDDDDEEIISVCEYTSNTHEMTHMLVIKREDDDLIILQGFEISEDDFQLVAEDGD